MISLTIKRGILSLLAICLLLPTATLPSSGVISHKTTGFDTPRMRKIAVATLIIWAIGQIRLYTKKSKNDLALANLKTDLAKLKQAKSIKEFVKILLQIIDDYGIGRKFSLLDIVFEEVNENGIKVKIKDKKINTTSFGVLGLFDGYVLQSLKGLIESVSQVASVGVALANFKMLGDIKGAADRPL